MEKPTVSSIPAGDNTFSKHARFYTYLGYRDLTYFGGS